MPADDRPGGPAPQTRSIKLRPFEPGDYEVRVVVTDRKANEMTSRRASFAID
jgi:hypothetical protein